MPETSPRRTDLHAVSLHAKIAGRLHVKQCNDRRAACHQSHCRVRQEREATAACATMTNMADSTVRRT